MEYSLDIRKLPKPLIAVGMLLFLSSFVLGRMASLNAIVFWLLAAMMGIVLFTVLATLAYLIYIIFSGPLVSLSEKGLKNRSSLFSTGYLAWDEVERVSLVPKQDKFPFRGRAPQFVRVELKDNAGYMAVKNALQRFLIRYNLKQFGAPVVLSTYMLPVDAETLAKRVEEYRRSAANYL